MNSMAIFVLSEERRKYLCEMISYWQSPEPSEIGIRCADLLATLVGGMHHLDGGDLVNWSNPRYVDITLSYPSFATFDSDVLTRFVFLCHDRGIRAEMKGGTKGRLRLILFPRATREGECDQKHPTIETALEKWRQAYPAQTVSLK